MPLPKYDKNKSSVILSEPVYASLFKIESDQIEDTLLESIKSYKVKTKSKTIELSFYINEDNIDVIINDRIRRIKADEINILLHNKKDIVLKKLTFTDLLKSEFEVVGDYNDNELSIVNVSWKYNDLIVT